MRSNAGSPREMTARGAAALFALVFCLVLTSSAQADPLGVVGFFGNSGAAAGSLGGEFSGPGAVAVNDTTGDVYVADTGNDRIQRFDADGNFEWAMGFDVIAPGKPGNQTQNELQEISISGNPTGGTFKLRFPETTSPLTVPLNYNATVAQVQAGLEGLTAIGPGNVAVSLAPGGDPGGGAVPGGPWHVEFVGTLADTSVKNIVGEGNGLVVPAPKEVTISTLVEGAGVVERCAVAADCKGGIPLGVNSHFFGTPVPGGGVASPRGIAIDQASGDLYVSDTDYGRIQQFDEDGEFVRAWGRDVVESGPAQANEQQRLTVDAGAGQYRIGYYATSGRGRLTNGAPTITRVNTLAGSFAVGQPISGQGIPAGTTIVAVGAGQLTLSANATQTAGEAELSAGPLSITPDIEWDEPAAAVEAKLAALAGIGAGNVTVSAGPGGAGGTTPYLVSFTGALANANLAPLVVSAGTALLSGGTGAAVATFNEGAEGFEVCQVAASCSQGRDGITVPGGAFSSFGAIGYVAVAPAGAPNARNVIVGDGYDSRVQEFSSTGQFLRTFGFDTVSSGPGNAGAGFEICRASTFDICKEGLGGKGLGQFSTVSFFSLSDIRVAVDASGAIYTVEPRENFRVQKFTPAPGEGLTPSLFNPMIESLAAESPGTEFPLSGASEGESPTNVAIDPVDGHIYVTKACTAIHCPGTSSPTERRVYEFESTGALVETHFAGYDVPAVDGLAVKGGGDPVYLTSGSPKPGVYIGGEPGPPHATVAATTAISASCATLHGTVNPNGGGPLHSFYRFEYRPVGAVSWSKAPVPDADIGSGETAVAIEEGVCDLEPGKNYEVRVIATKGGAPVTSSGDAGNFTTDLAGPTVQTFAAFWDTGAGELVLRGSVNPNNAPTTYYFDYGTEPCGSDGCASVPVSEDAGAGAGGNAVTVSQRLPGLALETTYHFRIVADNGVGAPVAGSEGAITTPGAAQCANEAVRVGASASLPECRAYERVSNGDSWGSGIGTIVGSIADSGERASFTGQAFGQPQSVPGPSTPYVAQREEGGWDVRQVVPTPILAGGSYSGTQSMVAADLRSALWPQSSHGQRLRGEVRWGSIALDGNESFATDLLVPIERSGEGTGADEYPLMGASADLSSFVFVHKSNASGVALVPGETPLANLSNLYQVKDGGVDVVNRASNSSPGTPGAIIGGACGAGLGSSIQSTEPPLVRGGAVSADGAVVHFTVRPGSPPPGSSCTAADPTRLFKRIDGETTVEVSACAKSDPEACTEAGDDRYRGASRDGSVTFFVSPRQLTDSDSDSSQDLYVHDESLPPGERLMQASAGEVVSGDHPVVGAGAEVQGVLDNASDGSRVYFVAKGRLTAAATKGANNLYVFERDAAHASGRIGFVGVLGSGEASGTASSYALPGGEGGDGRFLLFTSAARLLAEDTDSASDLYRYEDPSGEMLCLTCMGGADFDVAIAARGIEASSADYVQGARPASADVSAVVFTSAEGLVDDDLNGARDVYLWREGGALSLVSARSGQDGVQASGSESAISPDGRDVFFITRTSLVGADVNNGLDLYDSRVGGGFAEAAIKPSCQGAEECQGAPAGGPAPEPGPGSMQPGPGNPKQAKPCKKGFVRTKGKCVKKPKAGKHKKRHGQRANNKRGGKR